MTMVLPFRTSTYARNIYLLGITSFSSISEGFRIPIYEYVGANYSTEQIQYAYENSYINEEEYQEIMEYISP